MINEQQEANKLMENATDILCPKCGSPVYEKVAMIKKLSAIISPSGQEQIIPIEGFRCIECKYIMTPTDVTGNTSTEENKPSLIIQP